MSKDPIVEEIRAIRDEYARRFNYDIEAMCRDFRAREPQSGHEVVTLPPKRLVRPPGSEGEAA